MLPALSATHVVRMASSPTSLLHCPPCEGSFPRTTTVLKGLSGENRMKIGVVMPTYNQMEFLPKALESYQKQTYPSQFVAVNDGSTDETQHVLMQHKPGVPWIYRPVNEGTAKAINVGISALTQTSEFDALTWISSDNEMDPDWLRVLAANMGEFQAGVVYSGFYYVKNGVSRNLFVQHNPNRLINDVNCYYGPSFLIRADVWVAAGPHRGKISHDYDHWLRVEEECFRRNLPIIGVDKPLCHYNAHDKRVTVTRVHEFDAHHWQAEARRRRGL